MQYLVLHDDFSNETSWELFDSKAEATEAVEDLLDNEDVDDDTIAVFEVKKQMEVSRSGVELS